MTDFKDVLKQLRQDPSSVSLQEFARHEMRRLLSKRSKSSDTIKRKRKCSALQKEMVTMGEERFDSFSRSLLPPAWRGRPTTKEEAVEKILYLIEAGYGAPDQGLTKKEKENERMNIRSILEDMDPKRIFLKNPERVSFNEVDQTIARLRYEFLGDPLKFEVEGIDPEVLRKIPVEEFVKNARRDERNEFYDDPEVTEMETGIHYEIKIHWEGGAPERVCNSLERIYVNHMKLFLCVPEKFAGAALLVAMEWEGGKEGLAPKEMQLVSTGFCFESSKDIVIEKSDRIYIFNGSKSLFQVKDFSLCRKSDIIVYKTKRKEGCP